LVESLQQVKVPSEGGLYQLVFVSIDPDETPADAISLRNRYVKRLGHPPSGRDWHFLTGPAEVTKRIAGIVGFDYALDEASGEYAHPAGFVVLTPQGRIARYFFGVSFSARELASVIRDAGQGSLGARIKEFVLLCFHYSPLKGRYSREVMQVVRIGGICTLIGLGAVLYRSSRSRRRSLNRGGET
jgi:protein SCO1